MALPPDGQKPSSATEIRMDTPDLRFTLSLNGAIDAARVVGSRILLGCAAGTDNFSDPDEKLSNNTAPLLLAEVDNAKPFTFTGHIDASLVERYDAGTFYIWACDQSWLKFAVEQDDRGQPRFVTVRTEQSSDDCNHDRLLAGYALLKISSDTRTIGFYYAIDWREWQMVRLFRNSYPKRLWVGIGAQSPCGNGINAEFSDLRLTTESISDFRMGV